MKTTGTIALTFLIGASLLMTACTETEGDNLETKSVVGGFDIVTFGDVVSHGEGARSTYAKETTEEVMSTYASKKAEEIIDGDEITVTDTDGFKHTALLADYIITAEGEDGTIWEKTDVDLRESFTMEVAGVTTFTVVHPNMDLMTASRYTLDGKVVLGAAATEIQIPMSNERWGVISVSAPNSIIENVTFSSKNTSNSPIDMYKQEITVDGVLTTSWYVNARDEKGVMAVTIEGQDAEITQNVPIMDSKHSAYILERDVDGTFTWDLVWEHEPPICINCEPSK